jgi:hypothetical protein
LQPAKYAVYLTPSEYCLSKKDNIAKKSCNYYKGFGGGAGMSDHLDELIKDIVTRNKDFITENDFLECREAVTDIAQIVEKLEATQIKFRRKLTDEAAQHPYDSKKIIYLQGLADGINLVVAPLKRLTDAGHHH